VSPPERRRPGEGRPPAKAAPGDPAQLAQAIAGLADLPTPARAQQAKLLIDQAKATLAAVRRAAILEMLDTMTYKQAARELGVSTATINAAVTEQHALERRDHETT
jgi:DNA-directed RNA polymerase specialized sigma24 family protein